ncbi:MULTISPECIES: 2-dehydro-3-deoxy-6-phosphogalactonate aldolase [Citrobacter]|uniref:2-dehydro-3-deoxy-6-phosphogalactonate aldolase n=1 Tax=Citrobacter TaxID=544 RepID=UPI0025752B8F|nr:2-dehydro-3-deoxy-6-phosphogalactonate aldolase [Citrobacter sp. Cb009]MDM3444736.1 2-dehydro-3-deoxy-6-phosphogalactonate aldolase [Citrobacter sp. Cb009]
MDFITTLRQTGLIAILRGIPPEQVEAVGAALYEQGFRIIEVPLNSPEPLLSISRLRRILPSDCWVGAGTVMTVTQLHDVAQSGGQLIISPHTDPVLIEETKRAGLISLPGAATPGEAFSALAKGADAVKQFPAEAIPPVVVKAWRAVIPATTPLLPVGGITPQAIFDYRAAGASGFGLGGALYQPGMTAEQVASRAADFVTAWRTSSPLNT